MVRFRPISGVAADQLRANEFVVEELGVTVTVSSYCISSALQPPELQVTRSNCGVMLRGYCIIRQYGNKRHWCRLTIDEPTLIFRECSCSLNQLQYSLRPKSVEVPSPGATRGINLILHSKNCESAIGRHGTSGDRRR
jgi:hypothetical protein